MNTTIDFTKIEILDVKGEKADMGKEKMHEQIGNLIFKMCETISMEAISKKIYNGEKVELRKEDIDTIKRLFNSEGVIMIPMMKRQIISFIDSKIKD